MSTLIDKTIGLEKQIRELQQELLELKGRSSDDFAESDTLVDESKITSGFKTIFHLSNERGSSKFNFSDSENEKLFWELLGYSVTAEIRNLSFMSLLSHNDFEKVRSYLDKLYHNEEPNPVEISYLTTNNDCVCFWLLGRISAREVDSTPIKITLYLVEQLPNDSPKDNLMNTPQEVMHFRRLFDFNLDGIAILRHVGKQKLVYLEMNDKSLEQLSLRREEAIGKSVCDAVPGLEKTNSYFKIFEALKKQEVVYVTFEPSQLIGKGKYYDLQIIPISWNEIILITKDVTEAVRNKIKLETQNKQLKNALQKAKENERLKSAFLTNMSHEIRTPMNGILGFTSLLERSNLSGEKQKEYIKIIQKGGNRLLKTVNNLIDISKIEAGQVRIEPTIIDIKRFMNDIYDFFLPETQNKNLDFELCELSMITNSFYIDTDKLNSILCNLIKNAIKYTLVGKISIYYFCDAKGVHIMVRDTGVGIPLNRQSAIFNRFEQADIEDTNAMEGAGLGLSITKSYVELMNGSIQLTSTPEVGSSFHVHLPLNCLKPTDKTTPVYDYSKKSSESIVLLLVEDDADSMTYLKLISSELDSCKVLEANNGYDAAEICKQNETIDVVLMDIRMPVLDGYQACKRIKADNPSIKVIAQTANAFNEDRQLAFESGFDDYLTKPISEEDLQRSIIRVLKE